MYPVPCQRLGGGQKAYAGSTNQARLRLSGTLLGAIAIVESATVTATHAQEGDSQRGLTVVQVICASCHAVRRGERSPNINAPAFTTIADVPGMTAVALQVTLQTSHKTMPNIVLSDDARRDVIAYILSLKSK